MNDEIELTPRSEEELRKAAISSIKRKREFTQHVVSYLVVNAVLIGIWAISGAGYFWPAWVIGGWGIGLVIHAWDTYGRRRMVSEDEVSREMDRLRRG
ncbi:MAG: 2TM domain-containing protein [Solirubrobacterales bacterium]|nr:2TM domain-containing protein [Solirubrobacterales bacterium]